ncbi:hypothetical protein HRI_000331700 [Hibiscus trionum]|uniref:Uncharacterized protein n=1 Tax=Hibiscus trionum TaxID=183268 RepID=A0A9W7GW04_HIBTR|nr:hypothetical protein HRI_000331700 [Hibiscus trionum]
MGRAPCCEKVGLKKGRWTAEEDGILTKYIQAQGEGSWRSLPKNAGLLRCGKSCRLRWINYLRSDLKRGNFTVQEEETIIQLHESLGNRWSLIASHLKGRTDNEIKNYWNSQLSRKMYRFRTRRASCQSLLPFMDKTKANAKPRATEGNESQSTKTDDGFTTAAAVHSSYRDTAVENSMPCSIGCIEKETDILDPFESIESSELLCFGDIMDDELLQTKSGDSYGDFGDLADSCFSTSSCFVDDCELDNWLGNV